MPKGFPDLHSGPHTSGWAAVVAPRLSVAGEELETFEVVRPNTESTGSSVAADGVMSSISVVLSAKPRRGVAGGNTNLMTSRKLLFLAKLTAAWTCLTLVALITYVG
jgi:hypothetical protein